MQKTALIYVAGHTGLVGSAIWKNLLSKGYTNLIGKTIDELDLTNQLAVDQFYNATRPEYVFVAAARVGGILANNTYRAEFIYDNLMIQNNLIHHAYKYGVKKLLFLGSTCIYPRECPQPMKEEYLLTSPLEYTNEPYAIAKITGIKLCESYNIQYGTDFMSVMPTNLYGPNDNFDLEKSHVLPAMIRKIHLGRCLETNDWAAIAADLNKRPVKGVDGHSDHEQILAVLADFGILPPKNNLPASIEIWGTGKPMREFLWSEEMADACVFVMENVSFKQLTAQNTTEVRNTHINIGTGKEISINELANLIKNTIGFQGQLVFNTAKPDGTMRKLTDPSKINNLGWKHKIEIEEGVRKMFEWYLN